MILLALKGKNGHSAGSEGRNSYIVLRVLFCVFVCLFHRNRTVHFGGSYLGVDFFFILSGFYLMRDFEWDRVFLAFLFAAVVAVFIHHVKSLHDFLLTALVSHSLAQVEEQTDVSFVGRLGEYRYYDMDDAIAVARERAARER